MKLKCSFHNIPIEIRLSFKKFMTLIVLLVHVFTSAINDFRKTVMTLMMINVQTDREM